MSKLKEAFNYTAWGAMIFALLYIPIGVLGHKGYGVGFNPTESEPLGFYVTHPIGTHSLKLNEMVAFNLPSDSIAYKDQVVTPSTYLIKKVKAVPNQYLFTQKDQIFVCNQNALTPKCESLGHCLKVSVHGHALQCQQWQGYKVPKDTYYMSSQRVKDSYDSRYFGLVKKSDVKRYAKYLG